MKVSPFFSFLLRLLSILFFLIDNYGLTAQPRDFWSSPEKVIVNAKIFTADPQQPYAEAIAWRGDTIVAVGTKEEVLAAIGEKANIFDLAGGFLMPGIIDSHIHAVEGGVGLAGATVDEENLTIDSLAAYAKEVWQNGRGRKRNILFIDAVSIATWTKADSLNYYFNSPPFSKLSVLLAGSDGHTAWANQKMLQQAGITEKYRSNLSPEKQLYVTVNSQGEPTGQVSEDAVTKLMAMLPLGEEAYSKGMQAALEYCHALGITAILDPAAASFADTSRTRALRAYFSYAKSNELKLHVAAAIVADPQKAAESQIRQLEQLDQMMSTGDLRIIGFKVFADGVVEYPTQTAALSKPYRNSGKFGNLLIDPDWFADLAIRADKANWLLHIHAIGDRAVTVALDGFEKMRRANPAGIIPHTITHLQLVKQSDFSRFSRLNILASMQLLWAFGDETAIDIVQPYVDSTFFHYQYPARSLLQNGATICGASDWPVSTANPFKAIERAMTRKGPMGVLNPDECMPREEMLLAYSINAAKALRWEDEIGSLKAGKLADFIWVNQDLLTVSAEELGKTKVKWTVFRGEKVYEEK